MTDAEAQAGQPAADDTDVIEVTLPAQGAYVSLLRTIAASLGARLDFTLDDIEDLRIAVNEASALLLARAVAETSLRCQFRLDGERLTVSVAADIGPNATPADLLTRDSFAWTVLDALSDAVRTTSDATGAVVVELTKQASTPPAVGTEANASVQDADGARTDPAAADGAGATADSAGSTGSGYGSSVAGEQ